METVVIILVWWFIGLPLLFGTFGILGLGLFALLEKIFSSPT